MSQNGGGREGLDDDVGDDGRRGGAGEESVEGMTSAISPFCGLDIDMKRVGDGRYLIEMVCLFTFGAVPFPQGSGAVDLDC